jgi:hypothetical protein
VLWRAQIRVDYWDEEIAAHAAARGLTVSDVVSEDEIVVTCTWETEVHRRAAPPCPPSPRSWGVGAGWRGAEEHQVRCRPCAADLAGPACVAVDEPEPPGVCALDLVELGAVVRYAPGLRPSRLGFGQLAVGTMTVLTGSARRAWATLLRGGRGAVRRGPRGWSG